MMLDFATSFTASGNDLGSVIGEILANDALALAQKNKLQVEAFQKVVRRSLVSTAIFYQSTLKLGLRDGKLGLEPLRRHPLTGVQMASVIKANRPKAATKSRATGTSRKILNVLAGGDRHPGQRLANIMEYRVAEETSTGDGFEVGALRQGRAGGKWVSNFAAWQDSDLLDVPGLNPSQQSMRNYLGALGFPSRSNFDPRRPARPVIKTVVSQNNPVEEFRKRFIERLYR